MPIVRPYPVGEVSSQPLPNVQLDVPAAGDLALFGGDRARDLQVAGQQLGQASDTLFALYQRHAQEANDSRVQDLTNQFMDGSRAILKTGPDAYYNTSGADAIKGADAATAKLKALKDETFGQTVNPYQRQRLGPILDAHFAAATAGIVRHTAVQQDVYSRRVASDAIETSRAEAKADPSLMPNALLRAEGAARVVHAGQSPEAVAAGVRAASGSVIADVIGDRLTQGDPDGITLLGRYGDRLDPITLSRLSAAADTLSNNRAAAAWVRERSAGLRTPAPTGDATLDAVNAASPPVAGAPLYADGGIAGTRERLDEIEARRRALTALNQQEFATNPTRLRANRIAIDTDTARSRAAVKADTDTIYADLRRHLTTGGLNGGPAVTPPPATIMSRLTEPQQDAVTAQVAANIEGRSTQTDPQTWYAIRQGLTSDDASERQRWATTNLVPFMGRLSAEDYAALEKLQSSVHSNDGGAEQRRLQLVTRMADDALRSAGIDPTPRPDAPPGSDAAQAARFHRAVVDDLSAFESTGRTPTEAEAYGIVNGLKDTGIKSGWVKARNPNDFLIKASDVPTNNDASNKSGVPQTDTAPVPAGQDRIMLIDVPTDPESYKRFLEEYRQREVSGQGVSGAGGANGAPTTEPDSSSPEYRAADAQARAIVAGQGENPTKAPRTEPSPRSISRDANMAVPMAPEWLPGGAVLGKLAEAVAQAARQAAARVAGAVAAASGIAAAEVAGGALALIVIPTNSQAEFVPIGENLRARIFTDQRSVTVEQRVDNGLFGFGAKWIDLAVGAAWGYDKGRRYIAIDRSGLEQAIGRDAADAALGGGGSAMARPPSKDDEEDEWGDEPRQEKSRSRDRRENRPPPAEDLEQRPDRAPPKPPHELSDEEIADIAHKIVHGHASDKHRIEQQEFPEHGSDPELEAHVAEVIKKHTEWKRLRNGRTAYWDEDSGTTVVDDAFGEGTVLRPEDGKRYYDDLDKPQRNRRR